MAGIKGTTVTGYIPELMDGTALGLDTATLGKDLDKLDEYGDLRDEIGDLSFNIFDIMDAYSKPVLLDKAAVKAFYKAVEVKKAGSETIDVNDYNVKCTAYHVVIPEDAMKDLLDAMKESVKAPGLRAGYAGSHGESRPSQGYHRGNEERHQERL